MPSVFLNTIPKTYSIILEYRVKNSLPRVSYGDLVSVQLEALVATILLCRFNLTRGSYLLCSPNLWKQTAKPDDERGGGLQL